MAEDDWAELGFREEAAVFKGPTQNARVWTEGWVEHAMFCPNCGAERIRRFANNSPVADFGCEACSEEYELKSHPQSAHPRGSGDPDRMAPPFAKLIALPAPNGRALSSGSRHSPG